MEPFKKHIGIRREDAVLHSKLHPIARYEGRSANAHILFLVRCDIEKFEREHGVILTEKENGYCHRRPIAVIQGSAKNPVGARPLTRFISSYNDSARACFALPYLMFHNQRGAMVVAADFLRRASPWGC